MRGAECEPVEIFLRSVPQMPQVCMRTRTSPAPISGTGTVSRRTSFRPRYTAARIVDGIIGRAAISVLLAVCIQWFESGVPSEPDFGAMGWEPGLPTAPFGATGLRAPLRVVEPGCSAPPSVTTPGGGPSPATFLRSQEHSASVARLLLRASRKIPGHCPGRTAAQAINDAVEKLPSLSTNWFSGGM